MTVNTIILDGGEANQPIVEEYLADTGSSIVPGDLLERDNATEVSEHSSAGGVTPALIALPNIANGGTIDDAYAVGETVRCGYLRTGVQAYGRVAAAATAIPLGAALQSAGDGTVALRTSTNHIVGYASEAVDNSGGGSVVRIKFRAV